MPGTVGGNQVASFTTPVNETNGNADEVRSNDNTMRAAFNIHDADATVHVQVSLIADRPAAGVAKRFWVTTDGNVPRLWYDNSTAWVEIDYLNKTQGGTIAGALTVGALTTAAITALGNAYIAQLSAANGVAVAPLVIDIGADGVLGALRLTCAMTPSATGSSRIGALSLADTVGYRELRIDSASLKLNTISLANVTVGNGLTVAAGGAAVTGDSSVTGSLAVSGTLSGGGIGLVRPVGQAATISQTTITPADTSLVQAVGASQVWRLELDVLCGCNNTGGVTFTVTVPAGATGSSQVNGPTSGLTTLIAYGFASPAFSGTFGQFVSASPFPAVRLVLYVATAGTAGNVTLQYSAAVAGQTVSVYAGSTLLATRIS